MKHLIKFEKFQINEFVDFEKTFDIDEEVLSYVFTDILNKYPYLGIKLLEVDNSRFKVEIFDDQPSEEHQDLDDEFKFLKSDKIYAQIKAHFDSMDFSIEKCDYDKTENKIEFIIRQLV